MEDLQDKFDAAVTLYTGQRPEDATQAYTLFCELVNSRFIPAYVYLGHCFFEGFGVPEDVDRAYALYIRGYEAGNGEATLMVGVCRYDGVGAEADHAEAYRLIALASERGYADASAFLGELPFTDEDGIPLKNDLCASPLGDDEVDAAAETAARGGLLSQFKLGEYYLSKAREGDYHVHMEKALQYAEQAKRGNLSIADDLIKRIGIFHSLHELKAIRSMAEDLPCPPTEDGHEANAVLVSMWHARPIYVEDFSCYAGLGKPLGCERINIVSTRGMSYLSAMFLTHLVGYVDGDGQVKELANNPIMSTVSGYPYLAGQCVICGFDRDYTPLDAQTAHLVAHWLDHITDLDRKIFRGLA